MSKVNVTDEQIKKLYDPNYFYDHQSNPALKRFMEIQIQNTKEGKTMDHRTYVSDKFKKVIFARNFDDFFQRDFKAYTFPKAFLLWTVVTGGAILTGTWCQRLIPVGSQGITKIGQTQFYHLYGPLGVACVLGFYGAGMYTWYKTTKFTGKKFYYHVLLGERNWIYEQERQNAGYGEYFFNDTPLASEESFPDLARVVIGNAGQRTAK